MPILSLADKGAVKCCHMTACHTLDVTLKGGYYDRRLRESGKSMDTLCEAY
jgi:hypothetical protein